MGKKGRKSVLPPRSPIYRAIKAVRHQLDGLIVRCSLIGDEAVLDAAAFPWTKALQNEWRVVRAEAEALMARVDEVPPLRSVSPDHRRIMRDDLWRSFFLYGYGYRVEANIARCPRTAALVEQIPGLNSAFFSILTPGAHIRAHRGPTKALITCHLGLMVPNHDSCRMKLDDRIVGWREGEFLIFDDTRRHEVWHEGDAPRVVLLIQVRRPLRGFGKIVADLFLAGVRRSPFVQEGRRNMAAWEQGMAAGDRPVD
jgi:aspartyl/asparaginyl beta-hydroxylase (cupin superfamily)